MTDDALTFADGCDLDFTIDPTDDTDVDAVVLFADIDPADVSAVARRRGEWEELFRCG